MTDTDKHKIATSFPDKFDQTDLGVTISLTDFEVFEKGIFADSMDEKWNVFVLDDILYLARSWTNFCIYKVFTQHRDNEVVLIKFQVNRDDKQYNSRDLEHDTVTLKKILQMYLHREDLYIDPKLDLPLIKTTIENLDPENEYKKSIGSNNVGLTKQIHRSLSENIHHVVQGWTDLEKNITNRKDDEPLISLFMQHRQNKTAFTMYFDKGATELLGQIIITDKISRR